MRGDEEESRCLYATRLKSWYDEHYNDWAKRYVRERLYGADGVDRAAIYMYTKLVPPPPQPGKKIGPVKVLGEQEFEITECKALVDLLYPLSLYCTSHATRTRIRM